MQRWITAIVGSMLMAFGLAAPVATQAQTTLVGGGLTSQPTPIYNDILANGGFETLSGGTPASWTPSGTWNADQIVKRSGTFSYRLGSSGAQATQTLQLQPGIYRLSGWIKTQSAGSGSVRLTLDFRPAINSWSPTPDLAGTNDWTYQEVLVTVPDARAASVVLDGYYAASGFQAWYDDVKLEMQKPFPVSVFMLYPNFRGMLFDDGPSTMKFDVSVTPPGGDLSRYKITGRLKNEATGQVLTTQDYPAAASFTAEMSGALMQTGTPYVVTFDLVDLSTSTTTYTYPAYRVSRVGAGQRGSMKIAFDEKNRVLLNGVPRFLLGVYDSGSGYSTSDSFWENQLWSPTGERRMDNMKINMYLNYWYGQAPLDAMNALMSNLQRHGVMYLQTGNCFDKWPADPTFPVNSSDTYVQSFGSHPAAAGYYTIDECLSSLIPGAFTQYDRLRRLDPDSVTFMANFGNADLPLWRDAVDVLSTDPYPLFGAEPAGGYNHGQVADWSRNTRLALKDSRPFNTVLQFFQFTSQGRWPTRQEMRNHAYMAIVEGARGLWWWSLGDNALLAVCSGWCTEKTNHMDDLKAVVNELADLEPALIADDAPTALTGNSNPGAIKTKVKVVNGTGYLFAYNSTNATAGATFTWNTAPGTVTVNAESRTLAASGNSFTDSFDPFQAHVYVLATGGTGSTGGGTTTAPTVTFTNPAATTTTVSGTITVTLAGSGGSGAGYTYNLAVDGTNVYNGTNGTFSWNTSTVSNAAHTLTATVTDSAGQSGTATRTLTVSNTTTTPSAPSGTLQVFITQPTGGATVSGTNWAVIWVNGASGTSNAYTLSVGAQTVGSTTTSSTGPVSIPWNTAAVSNGAQTLSASVKDAVGNTGTGSISVNVSNATTTPAPLAVSFSSPAAGSTVSGTVSVALSAAGGSGSGYTYTLAVDSAAPTTVTSPFAWNTTTVANGSHTLTASVKDSTGTTATTTRTVTVSNVTATPLAVSFSSPAAGATVSGTVSVALSAAGGSGSGYTYTLAVDSAAATTVSSPYAWNTTTVANGSHTLTATVKDSAGATATATRTVTVSNLAPLTVAISSPAATTVSGTVAFTATASGGTGYGYKLAIDGAQVATTSSYSWNTTTATNATHTLTATVTDAAGRSASASKTVTVSNTTASLTVAVTQPTGGATVSGTNWAVVWVTGSTGTNTLTLTAGGKTVGSGTGSGGGPFSIPWNTTLVADGTQSLTVSVRDGAGKTGTASVSVNVKNSTTTTTTPPPATGTLQVAITQPTGGSTVAGTAWVVMWVNGASGTSNAFTLSVDGVTVGTSTVSSTGPVTLPWNTATAVNGNHTITATVRDATGNTGSTSVAVKVAN